MTEIDDLTLFDHGAERIPRVLGPENRQAILGALDGQRADQAGVRLFGVEALRPFLAVNGVVGAIAASCMSGSPRPVRAILFDKTAGTNWSLGWHQDRVIAVGARKDAPGFGPWSRKHGALHVAPPADIQARMITLRVHLDAVPKDNAPLLVAPGSHRFGRIAEADVPETVRRCGVVACLAAEGDVWAYATPVLHASDAAAMPGRRRVLQIDYAAEDLPHGLEWLGI
ncbi:MAG: phytanoyl-CoA dioxygenase family protein [Caulobacteraceae bacterium]